MHSSNVPGVPWPSASATNYTKRWQSRVIGAVMAQEVAEIVAEAARATSDGYLCMNCQKLGLRVLTWGRMHPGAGYRRCGADIRSPFRSLARVHSTLPFAIIPLLHDEASFK